jgi:hypothetical protein
MVNDLVDEQEEVEEMRGLQDTAGSGSPSVTSHSTSCSAVNHSPTGQAIAAFIDQVAEIADARVACYGDEDTGKKVVVFVPSLWSEAADRVLELEGQILSQFPRAAPEIHVKGLEELGGTIDSVLDHIPAGATFAN